MSTYDTHQLEAARACIDQLGDSSQITITRTTPGAINTATGIRAETTTTATLTAIVSRVRSDAAGGSGATARRVTFTVLAEDCVDSGPSAFRPDENDRVSWSSKSWHVERVEARCGDQVYDLHCADMGNLSTQ